MQGAHDHIDPDTPALRLVGGLDDYDALAELFLGSEGRPLNAIHSSRPVSAMTSVAHTRAQPEIVVRPLRTSVHQPESPPQHPQPTPPASTGFPSPPTAHTPADSQTHREADTAHKVNIEALILGHLPVRSVVWIGQYARARAERLRRPVALLRLGATDASLDLHGLPLGAASFDGAETLEGAVERAHAVARDWIIQVDELSESSLAADDRLDAITLLTSANETAVIAAYRAIKGLVSAGGMDASAPTPGEARRPDVGDSPAMRVAIMGAGEEEAGAALARLRHACSVFLGRPLELAATVAKVSPARGVNLFRGPGYDLPSILELLAPPVSESRRTHDPSYPTASKVASTEAISARPAPSSGSDQPHSRRFDPAAQPLAELLPELRALSARCADDPEIELALGADGRLHLLRRADAPDACQRLVSAVAWAKRHAELLSLAAASVGALDPAKPPQAHLFTAEPPALRPLLDTEIRVHLLTPASPGASWLCVELN